MKIAVTGGSGFIGRWFIRKLSADHDLIIFGRNNVALMEVDGKMYHYMATDYSVERLLEQLHGCEAVVHLAAKRIAKDQTENYNTYSDTIRFAENLFEACRRLHIKNMVNVSSQSVYSHANTIPWSETEIAYPANFYGISKLTVEHLANFYNIKYAMGIKSLRVAQVLGVGEREGFMLTEFIKKAKEKQTLTLYGSGEGRREYIYVKDVVNAISVMLAKEAAGIYNIGTGVSTSHAELAETINEVFDNVGNLTFLPDQPEDKSIHRMNLEKTRLELGWEPQWPLEKALMDMKRIMANEAGQHHSGRF